MDFRECRSPQVPGHPHRSYSSLHILVFILQMNPVKRTSNVNYRLIYNDPGEGEASKEKYIVFNNR